MTSFPLTFLTTAIGISISLGCSPSGGEEEKIRRVVDEIIEGAEARDVGDILDHISESYSDDLGNKKAEIKGYLAGHFFGRKSLYVVKVGHEILMNPDDPNLASSQIKVLLAAGKGSIPNERDAQTFSVEWRKEDGDWRVIKADNREIRAGDLLGN